jgi:hypothetical protein
MGGVLAKSPGTGGGATITPTDLVQALPVMHYSCYHCVGITICVIYHMEVLPSDYSKF